MKKMTMSPSLLEIVLGEGRDVGREGGRGRRRGREILAQKIIEREYLYERVKERGVGGVKLKIPTFYGRSDLDEYLQYD